MGYVWALDLSMTCVGLSIFDNDAKVILITSVETKTEKNHQMKLKLIADRLLELREKYTPEIIVIEGGFSRFNTSTQVSFRVHGLINYLFWDVTQIYFQPTMVKKTFGGKGNMKKSEIKDKILQKFPNLHFSNEDESDSFSIGMCYFIKKDEGIYGKEKND